MKKIYSFVCLVQPKTLAFLLSLLFLLSFSSMAQNRNYGFVFSENIHGSTALFGNTLMHSVNTDGSVNTIAMNGNSVNGNSFYDNGNFGLTNMQFVDIDGNSGEGAGTKNSSSSDLVLPAGANTIRVARLYWGGRAVTSQFDMTQAANQKIKIRKGTSGAYQEFTAAQINKYVSNPGLSTEYCHYQAYIDITELVKQQGGGTYTVGDGAFSTGTGGDFGNYGGWSIMVVYENPALDFNSVRVYDGYQQIYSGGSVIANTLTLTGLNVPSEGLSLADAKIGLIGWEGDARFTGDFFKINNTLFSNSLNQSNNPWNGTITNNGAHVTAKNPNYTDQMGIDIDQANVGLGYGILPDASSVTLQLGTTQDQFFAGVICFVIKMKPATLIKLTKTVKDANNSSTAEAGEVLVYKLKGKNIGTVNANSVELTDSLPSTITFVNNSLKVNYGPGISIGSKTDAAGDDIAEYVASTNTVTFRLGNGATTTTGGLLAPSDSFEIEFKATVNTPTSGNVPPIINVGRLKAKTDAMVDHVDDATAVIDPFTGGTLPVSITSFTASLQQSHQVKLAWSSSMEFNCSRYDIERSTDGVLFKTAATKKAFGNSSVQNNYIVTDDITAVTAPMVYYRLNQIDIDGKASLSKLAAIRLNTIAGAFSVSPNPFRNIVNINIEWDKNETTLVKAFNAAGREVFVKNINMIKGYNNITIDELSQALPGSYIIQFISASGKMTKQVMKQQ